MRPQQMMADNDDAKSDDEGEMGIYTQCANTQNNNMNTPNGTNMARPGNHANFTPMGYSSDVNGINSHSNYNNNADTMKPSSMPNTEYVKNNANEMVYPASQPSLFVMSSEEIPTFSPPLPQTPQTPQTPAVPATPASPSTDSIYLQNKNGMTAGEGNENLFRMFNPNEIQSGHPQVVLEIAESIHNSNHHQIEVAQPMGVTREGGGNGYIAN